MCGLKLVKEVCDHYHDDAITKALETTFRILPEQTGSRIRRRRSRLKADNVSEILDLLQETHHPVSMDDMDGMATYAMVGEAAPSPWINPARILF